MYCNCKLARTRLHLTCEEPHNPLPMQTQHHSTLVSCHACHRHIWSCSHSWLMFGVMLSSLDKVQPLPPKMYTFKLRTQDVGATGPYTNVGRDLHLQLSHKCRIHHTHVAPVPFKRHGRMVDDAHLSVLAFDRLHWESQSLLPAHCQEQLEEWQACLSAHLCWFSQGGYWAQQLREGRGQLGPHMQLLAA